jgi:SAM-dependent methyltransferase
MSPAAGFESSVFSAPDARCTRFTEWVLARVDARRPMNVLDIGCGTGAQLLHLASALPQATLTGVDVSACSIEAAAQRARQSGIESRVRFFVGDYLGYRTPPQDLIVSYSTLQFIAVDSRALFGKIGADLVPGGLLMNVMAYECAYNRALLAVRRVFAALRTGATDVLVLRVAKLIHGREFDDELLAERVDYMYHRIERLDGPGLRKLMDRECGLESIAEELEAHASPAQLKHRLIVSRKRGSGS